MPILNTSLNSLPPGFWVALGGGAGAAARFHIGGWVTTWSHAGFPWPTFAINVAGSALLGFLFRALPPPAATVRSRALLMIGFCGGFTTFSTFDYETLSLLRQARFIAAGLYSAGSVACCIAGVYAGFAAAALASARRAPAGRT